MKIRKITSLSNRIVRDVVDIVKRKKKFDNSLFIAEGSHLVESALEGCAAIKKIFYTPEFGQSSQWRRIVNKLSNLEVDVIEVPEVVFSKMADVETPQGVLAVVSRQSFSLSDLSLSESSMLVVCDGISDPGNLGTIVRISEAAGADAIVILPDSCDPYSPKAVRATAGGLFFIKMVFAGREEFIDWIGRTGMRLFALDVRSQKSLYAADLTVPFSVVVGNESRGVSQLIIDKAHSCISIPMAGKTESLNAAVSAAIFLFEGVRQRTQRICQAAD